MLLNFFRVQNNKEFLVFQFSGRFAVNAMPLFSWMKWSHETRVQTQDEEAPLKTTGVVPSRRLIRELLWHMEDREQLARELEREHRLANSSMGVQWFQTYPRLQTLIPTSELYQLEFLCAQIPPIHAATVLYRCVLATLHPHISMLSTVASCYWITTRHDSRQSRDEPEGEGEGSRASCQEKPLCVTVTEAGDGGCEHGKVKPDCRAFLSSSSVRNYITLFFKDFFYMVAHYCDLLIYFP